jgi:hypothetical protein
MKLSKHDKQIVAMSWITEIFLNYLSQINENENIPEHKTEQYDELAKNFETARSILEDINMEFSGEIDSTFGADFAEQLTELTTRFATMYATNDIQNMLQFVRWIGMNTAVAKAGIEKEENNDQS